MYLVPCLGFQELGPLLHSRILNPELYHSEEVSSPPRPVLALLLVACVPSTAA